MNISLEKIGNVLKYLEEIERFPNEFVNERIELIEKNNVNNLEVRVLLSSLGYVLNHAVMFKGSRETLIPTFWTLLTNSLFPSR